MQTFTIGFANWQSELAKAFSQAKTGDQILLPNSEIYEHAKAIAESEFPEKKFILAHEKVTVSVESYKSTEDYVAKSKKHGKNLTEQDLLQWESRKDASLEYQKITTNYLNCLVDELIYPHQKTPSLQLLDRITTMLQEISMFSGYYVSMAKTIATLNSPGAESAFMDKLLEAQSKAFADGFGAFLDNLERDN